MSDAIKSDFELDQHCEFLAKEILKEIAEYGGDLDDLIHETVDGDANGFTYFRAHSICQNCNIDAGEDFVSETGGPEGGWSYDGFAVAIAYGEMLHRVRLACEELKEEMEEV